MKTQSSLSIAIKLVIFYLCVLIAGTVMCAVVYTIYSLCTSLVAGQGLPSFDFSYFLNGIFIFTPVVLIVSGVLMCLYLIRNSSPSWLPLIVYALLSVASWCLLMPLNFSLYNRIATQAGGQHPQGTAGEEQAGHLLKEPDVVLSPGYFRHEGDNIIFYYSFVDEKNVVDGVCIVPDAKTHNVQTFSGVALPVKADFSDNIIKDTVDMPRSVSTLVTHFRLFIQIAFEAFTGGFMAWLCFATISVALLSVAGLRHLSKWRLINVLLLICATVCIVVFNIFSYENSVLDTAKQAVNSKMGFLPLKNPFAALCNIAVFVIFTVLGLIIDIHRKSETDPDAEFEEGAE